MQKAKSRGHCMTPSVKKSGYLVSGVLFAAIKISRSLDGAVCRELSLKITNKCGLSMEGEA